MRYKSLDLIFLKNFYLRNSLTKLNQKSMFKGKFKKIYITECQKVAKKTKSFLSASKAVVLTPGVQLTGSYFMKGNILSLSKITKSLIYVTFFLDKKISLYLMNGGNFILFDFFFQAHPRIDIYNGKKNLRLTNSENKFGFKFCNFITFKPIRKYDKKS